MSFTAADFELYFQYMFNEKGRIMNFGLFPFYAFCSIPANSRRVWDTCVLILHSNQAKRFANGLIKLFPFVGSGWKVGFCTLC